MRVLRSSLGPVAVALGAAFAVGPSLGGESPAEAQARLVARSVLPAATSLAGSPPCGAYLSAEERTTAEANGVRPAEGAAYLSSQPVQGFSSMVPGDGGTWWALADNGFAWRQNSGDCELVFHRLDPRWGNPAGPRILATVVLRDPDRRIPWTIASDAGHGAPLPPFSFNRLPRAAGATPEGSSRVLTGFDFDPESFVRAPDGTFWIGEEFGPYLLHVAADGRLLEAPIGVPGVRSPQCPELDLRDRAKPERPTLAGSRGFEGLAISPDGATLYGLLEGAVTGDDPRDLRICVFDVAKRAFAERPLRFRLELPSQTVDLSVLRDMDDKPVYPGERPPARGPVAIGEVKAVNDHELLVIERDNLGDGLPEPRFKKVFLLDLEDAAARGGYVTKRPLLDLLAIPDPDGIGGDGDFFRLPFYTIESVHPVDERTLLIASDNNFPFSNGRSRSRSADRRGSLAPDDTELILVRLGAPLRVDPRLLPPGR